MASKKPYSLKDLEEALMLISVRKISTQLSIARTSGVDQSTISKAKRGLLKRKGRKTDVLMSTCVGLLETRPIGRSAEQEIHNFYSSGGTEKELLSIISHGTLLIQRALKE